MEVVLIAKNSIKLKGKNSTLIVDPVEYIEVDAALAIQNSAHELINHNFDVIIFGPGEYEIGGVKINGLRGSEGLVLNTTIDSISITLGTIKAIEKLQSKLKESNILIINCNGEIDASFLTSITTNTIILYGEKVDVIGKSVAGDNILRAKKYANTIDKLPADIETIILE